MASKKTWFTNTTATIAILTFVLAGMFLYITTYPSKGDTRITQRMVIQLHPQSYIIRTQLQYFDEHWYIASSWQKDVPWSKIARTKKMQQIQAEEWRKHLKMVLREFHKQP